MKKLKTYPWGKMGPINTVYKDKTGSIGLILRIC